MLRHPAIQSLFRPVYIMNEFALNPRSAFAAWATTVGGQRGLSEPKWLLSMVAEKMESPLE